MTNAIDLRASFNANASERVNYETSKNAHSCASQVIKTLRLDHKTFETTLSDKFFETLAEKDAVQSFDFINNSVKCDARFNVYALKKVMRKLESIVFDSLVKLDSVDQKFCFACIATLEKNRDKEEFVFNRKSALVMLSRAFNAKALNVKVSELARKFNVTESTASTQVSSSFRALEALDILRFDETDKARCTVSNVNREHAFYALALRTLEA